MLQKVIAKLRAANKRRLAARVKRQTTSDRTLLVAGQDLQRALTRTHGVPVLVVSYNNGIYVANTVAQLARLSIKPIVIDNASTDPQTRQILTQLNEREQALVVFSKKNYGHLVGFLEPLYRTLPNIFAYTDPDLQFHPELPPDFLDTLAQLTVDYGAYKAGCALTLEHEGTRAKTDNNYTVAVRKPFLFNESYEVQEWEGHFWQKKLLHPRLEIYSAPLDTTFAVYNKSMYRGDFVFNSLRVAGPFSALHLPWFPELDIMSNEQRNIYLRGNISSTWRTQA